MAALTDQGFAVTATLPTTIGLGRLVDLIIRDAQGHRLRLTPHGEQWLAWKPSTRDLVVLRPGTGEAVAAKMHDARRHHAFHGHGTIALRRMEWPSRHGPVRTVGLIESLTYTADEIRSPSKRDFHWAHQFGDRGERGHGRTRPGQVSPYPDRLLPRLDVDAMGSLWIVRRPGNTYTVREWIIG